jgi:hypothetical protein
MIWAVPTKTGLGSIVSFVIWKVTTRWSKLTSLQHAPLTQGVPGAHVPVGNSPSDCRRCNLDVLFHTLTPSRPAFELIAFRLRYRGVRVLCLANCGWRMVAFRLVTVALEADVKESRMETAASDETCILEKP